MALGAKSDQTLAGGDAGRRDEEEWRFGQRQVMCRTGETPNKSVSGGVVCWEMEGDAPAGGGALQIVGSRFALGASSGETPVGRYDGRIDVTRGGSSGDVRLISRREEAKVRSVEGGWRLKRRKVRRLP